MNEEKMYRTDEPEVSERPVERDKAPKKLKPIAMKVDNCSRVNMRVEADPDAEIVKTIDRGTVVYVDPSFKDESFVAVKEDSVVVGYIKKDFLSAV